MTFYTRWPAVQKAFRNAGGETWDEADHPRGKTTPESNEGSFAPKGTAEGANGEVAVNPEGAKQLQAEREEAKGPVSWYKVRDKVEPGAILVSSWGYDQTNIDYYEVVGLTSSGKSAILRPMGKDNANTKHWTVMPAVSDYGKSKTGGMTKRILGQKDGGENRWEKGHVKITDYQRAYLWDGKPDYETPPGFGH